jgi:hypothetical protein
MRESAESIALPRPLVAIGQLKERTIVSLHEDVEV